MGDKSRYVLPNETNVSMLDCTKAFDGLEPTEKLYAHYLSRASWYGGLIVYLQTSPESLGIHLFLFKLFTAHSLDELKKLALDSGLTDDEHQALLVYAAAFFANSGNYKSFGDTKFIPNLPQEKFNALVQASAVDDEAKSMWSKIVGDVYCLSDRRKELGLSPMGVTTYFSSNCDKKDAEFIGQFLTEKDIKAYNTRLFKTIDTKTGDISYEVRLASSESDGKTVVGMPEGSLGKHTYTCTDPARTASVNVTRGDYSGLMAKVNDNLVLAKKHGNDTERQMIEDYMTSFETGSIPAHMDGSRHWIRNKGPIVETYIGFIEYYRDPFGSRAEFEGFVAVVNKEMSARLQTLVDNAVDLLPLLPWPSIYEKDAFLKPDFTSLDVLAFAGSGVPAGINIPNYDDIRQTEGFKNVSLGNVIACGYKDQKVTFLSPNDTELYTKLKLPSFEVQVGLHELLGHGSGKLFKEDDDGKLNFDQDIVMDLISGEPVTTWYKANDTWSTVFNVIAPSYEECRAECVGLFLCMEPKVLRIFGHEDNGDDIVYINWLNMVRAGLIALEFYTPATSSWGQAHMQARYCILRVLLEAGQDLVKIDKVTGEDGQPDLQITIDRANIATVGKTAIGDFLIKLQAHKSMADSEGGKVMWDHYSSVTDVDPPHFLTLREIVLARKQPRRMLVQHNTKVKGDNVKLLSYESTCEGLIQSVMDRFSQDTDLPDLLTDLWRRDQHHFTY